MAISLARSLARPKLICSVRGRKPFRQRPIPSGRRRCRCHCRAVAVGLLLRILNWLSIRRGFQVESGESNRSAHLPYFRNQGGTLLSLSPSHPLPCPALPFSPRTSCGTTEPTIRGGGGAIYTAEIGVHHFPESLSLFYEDNGFNFSSEHRTEGEEFFS